MTWLSMLSKKCDRLLSISRDTHTWRIKARAQKKYLGWLFLVSFSLSLILFFHFFFFLFLIRVFLPSCSFFFLSACLYLFIHLCIYFLRERREKRGERSLSIYLPTDLNLSVFTNITLPIPSLNLTFHISQRASNIIYTILHTSLPRRPSMTPIEHLRTSSNGHGEMNTVFLPAPI